VLPLILAFLFLIHAAARADDFQPVVESCVAQAAVNGCAAAPQVSGAFDLAVSPEGRSAYGVSPQTDSIQAFDRDPATGRLTAGACVNHGRTLPPAGRLEAAEALRLSAVWRVAARTCCSFAPSWCRWSPAWSSGSSWSSRAG
jgi:hypothetical protein